MFNKIAFEVYSNGNGFNMSTKVFLSWSGELSRSAAEIFKNWLEIVIQELDVFYSEDDIAKGTNGIKTIFSNLQESVASVIMLTKENQTSPWICFEAGAMLSKKEEAPACGLLLDFSIAELEGPLKNLQQTTLEKKDVYKLLKTLNSKCSAPLAEERLKRAFDNNWESLHQDLTKLISKIGEEKSGKAALQKTVRPAKDKKSAVTPTSEEELPMELKMLKNHKEGILELLNAAMKFNNKGKHWTIRGMAQVLKKSISQTEALTEIARLNNFVSQELNYVLNDEKDMYLYKITMEGILLLSELEKRRAEAAQNTEK